MFAYIDPTVKQDLIVSGKLFALDENGELVPSAHEDAFIKVVGPIPLPVAYATTEALPIANQSDPFDWYAWVKRSDLDRIEQVVKTVRQHGPRDIFSLLSEQMAVNSALVYGNFSEAENPIVRIHSNCLTGDVFGSLRCDCGPQLHKALATIAQEGVGAVIYMAGHEGRGIGLWAKAITYLLQDAGHDTYQANEHLGLPADSRDFGDAARILSFLRGGNKKIRLLGNNPLKCQALKQAGFEIIEQKPLVVGVNDNNIRYLTSKREHGHIIPIEALKNTNK
ncbi:MAG: GTP cyclohydrolase II [Deltaproteobacteria bacterium]|nr:GTP cyclohydrolase II [Deltaproteobacteria bacterium]